MSKKIEISKEQLIELTKTKTVSEIAKLYNCSLRTVYNWYERYELSFKRSVQSEIKRPKKYNYDDTYFLYGKFEDEKKQIFSYLKEILLFAPNTKVVINVASVEKEKEYIDLKFFTGLIKKIPLNIEVKIDKSNEIFVEE